VTPGTTILKSWYVRYEPKGSSADIERMEGKRKLDENSITPSVGLYQYKKRR